MEWDLQRVGDLGVGVELENWVEPSRPRNDKEKLHDFIVQEGLLQLQPPVGQLGPGESTTWTITYRQACTASPEAVQSCDVWDAHMGSVILMTAVAVLFYHNWFRSYVPFVICHVMLLPGTDAGLRQSLMAECFYNML